MYCIVFIRQSSTPFRRCRLSSNYVGPCLSACKQIICCDLDRPRNYVTSWLIPENATFTTKQRSFISLSSLVLFHSVFLFSRFFSKVFFPVTLSVDSEAISGHFGPEKRKLDRKNQRPSLELQKSFPFTWSLSISFKVYTWVSEWVKV